MLDDLSGQRGVVTTTRSPLPPKPAVRRVSEQAFQARCAPLSKAPHLPMSSKSKPRQTSGARAHSPAPASPRHRQAGKKYWAEHCRRSWRRPNLRNTRRSKRHLVLDLKERWARTDCASTPVDRAALAAPAAVGGGAFGPTRSVAVSERGHGQHLLQQDLKPVRQLRARAQDLGTEASCVRFAVRDRCDAV